MNPGLTTAARARAASFSSCTRPPRSPRCSSPRSTARATSPAAAAAAARAGPCCGAAGPRRAAGAPRRASRRSAPQPAQREQLRRRRAARVLRRPAGPASRTAPPSTRPVARRPQAHPLRRAAFQVCAQRARRCEHHRRPAGAAAAVADRAAAARLARFMCFNASALPHLHRARPRDALPGRRLRGARLHRHQRRALDRRRHHRRAVLRRRQRDAHHRVLLRGRAQHRPPAADRLAAERGRDRLQRGRHAADPAADRPVPQGLPQHGAARRQHAHPARAQRLPVHAHRRGQRGQHPGAAHAHRGLPARHPLHGAAAALAGLAALRGAAQQLLQPRAQPADDRKRARQQHQRPRDHRPVHPERALQRRVGSPGNERVDRALALAQQPRLQLVLVLS